MNSSLHGGGPVVSGALSRLGRRLRGFLRVFRKKPGPHPREVGKLPMRRRAIPRWPNHHTLDLQARSIG
jgi:hypothetical protein